MAYHSTRRTFLKRLLGSMAATSVVIFSGRSTAQNTAESLPAPSKSSQGYHETDHIRAYYQKINF